MNSVADALERAANAMQANPRLDPDSAVRFAVWGDPNTPYPGDDAPGAETFDYAESAIECYCGWQGNGIDRIPRRDAIRAARAEAARYRSYGR